MGLLKNLLSSRREDHKVRNTRGVTAEVSQASGLFILLLAVRIGQYVLSSCAYVPVHIRPSRRAHIRRTLFHLQSIPSLLVASPIPRVPPFSWSSSASTATSSSSFGIAIANATTTTIPSYHLGDSFRAWRLRVPHITFALCAYTGSLIYRSTSG